MRNVVCICSQCMILSGKPTVWPKPQKKVCYSSTDSTKLQAMTSKYVFFLTAAQLLPFNCSLIYTKFISIYRYCSAWTTISCLVIDFRMSCWWCIRGTRLKDCFFKIGRIPTVLKHQRKSTTTMIRPYKYLMIHLYKYWLLLVMNKRLLLSVVVKARSVRSPRLPRNELLRQLPRVPGFSFVLSAYF